MARNSDRLTLRNELISKEYAQLFFVEGKRDEVIFDYLAEKYYLQPSTIEKIILKISKTK